MGDEPAVLLQGTARPAASNRKHYIASYMHVQLACVLPWSSEQAQSKHDDGTGCVKQDPNIGLTLRKVIGL